MLIMVPFGKTDGADKTAPCCPVFSSLLLCDTQQTESTSTSIGKFETQQTAD